MVNFSFIEYINTHKHDSRAIMRIRGPLAVMLLTVSLLSYGASDSALADSHNIPPISVSTELPSYGNGDRVNVSGSIRDYDPADDAGQDVLIMIKAPNGALVDIGQVTPGSDGTFSASFVAAIPMWKAAGDYSIEVRFGAQGGKTVVVYAGGEAAPAPQPVTCGPDQDLVDGQCIDRMPQPVTCGPDQDLVDGQCIDRMPQPVTCGPDQDLVDGQCIDRMPQPVTCGPDQDLVDGQCIDKPASVVCGEGTMAVDGQCVPVQTGDGNGGGCLIATAAYGSEMAHQVQSLREVRDNVVMSTSSGAAFMDGFNQWYYSFSPAVADLERENQAFREAVRAFITPMMATLSIMTLADPGSEAEVLGLGASVIALNLGMYVAAPALVGFKVHRHLKSRQSAARL